MTAVTEWHAGAEAFARGELPPADPDKAEGWYYAENAAALAHRPFLVVPGSPRDPATPAEALALAGGWPAIARWALPRLVTGLASLFVLAFFAFALIGDPA